MRNDGLVILGFVGSVLVSATAAAAQESRTTYSIGERTIEEVTVTAQKREELLIDVPQSVSVLSGSDLAKLGAVQFTDFANTVPGLSYTSVGAGYSQITLRGVTAGFDIGHTVATYVDEVPIGFSSAQTGVSLVAVDQALFDVDRIEVLRGPQGTLYGASSLGGLIKYVSQRPNPDQFAMQLRTGVSDTRDGGVSHVGSVAANIPLVADTLTLRASAYESRDGGFIDNPALSREDVNRSDVYGGRLDLLFTPTDALTLRLNGFLQNISRDGQATADYTFAGAPRGGKLEQYRQFPEPYNQQFRLVSGTLTYEMEPATLTAISSYQTVQADYVVDISGQFVPLLQSLFDLSFRGVGYNNELTVYKFTQELRLASNQTGPIEWLAGGFYTREKTSGDYSLSLVDGAGMAAPNNIFGFTGPGRFEEVAGFADVTYHFGPKVDVTAGVRYAQNEQSQTQISTGLLLGVPPGLVSRIPNRESKDHAFTYLGNARYHFSDNATAYVRYATGYRPGGPNTVASDPATGLPVAPATFEPDRLSSYEVGFKVNSADRRLGMEVSTYYIDWKDIHILAYVNGIGITANALGGATVRGAELSLNARPLDNLNLTTAFAYQDAKISEADVNLGAANDERLPNVPRFTATGTLDYTFNNVSWHPTAGATIRHTAERYASFNDSVSIPQYRLPSYTLLDLRTGVSLGSVDVQFWMRNVFNKFAQISADTSRGSVQLAISAPRTIGVSVTAHF